MRPLSPIVITLTLMGGILYKHLNEWPFVLIEHLHNTDSQSSSPEFGIGSGNIIMFTTTTITILLLQPFSFQAVKPTRV